MIVADRLEGRNVDVSVADRRLTANQENDAQSVAYKVIPVLVADALQ